MFCRNCSNEVSLDAIACPKCGVPPLKGCKFCYNCGSPTHEQAIICVSCGLGLRSDKEYNSDKLLNIWSRYSYTTYLVILLLSFLPFIDIQCMGKRVENITGLDMAIGSEMQYQKTESYTNIYGYPKERYVTETQNLFSWDILFFYILIAVCIFLLITKRQDRFKSARILTIIALIILVEWCLKLNYRMNTIKANAFEFSFGNGFWLTLTLTAISLGLLFLYLKKLRQTPPSGNIYNPTIERENITPNVENIIPGRVVEKEILWNKENNLTSPVILKSPVNTEFQQTHEDAPDKSYDTHFPKKKSPLLFIVIPVLIILGLATWYFAFKDKKEDVKIASENTFSDTTTKIESANNTLGTSSDISTKNKEDDSIDSLQINPITKESGDISSSNLSDDEIKTILQIFMKQKITGISIK